MKMNNKFKYNVIGIIGFVILTAFDQFTKYLAITRLKPLSDQGVDLITGVFKLQYLENRGAAFGLFQNMQWIFIVLSVICVFIIAFYYNRIPNTKKYALIKIIGIALAAGAVGNCIDRICNNFVVDFFYFSLIDFPIFNVADIYVTCGMILLFILLVIVYKEEDLKVFQISSKKEKNS